MAESRDLVCADAGSIYIREKSAPGGVFKDRLSSGADVESLVTSFTLADEDFMGSIGSQADVVEFSIHSGIYKIFSFDQPSDEDTSIH